MPAYKYSHNYDIEEQAQIMPKKKTFKPAIKPVKNKKPIKVTQQDKVVVLNFTLLLVGCFMTFVFVGIYSMVALSETRLSELHSQISNLNYENIDLENKLENIKSYNSVDTKVTSTATFDKAKNVIEVDKVDAKVIEHSEPKANNLNTVTGF